MTWRDQYAPLIARIIAEHADPAAPIAAAARKAIRRQLRASFPGDSRRSFQYKTWLNEARVQMGMREPARDRGRPPRAPRTLALPNPKQRELFPDLVTFEIRLIQSVIDAAAGGLSAGAIHKAAPIVITYRVAVRILDLARRGKTAPQILKYLESDEATRRAQSEEIEPNGTGTKRQPGRQSRAGRRAGPDAAAVSERSV